MTGRRIMKDIAPKMAAMLSRPRTFPVRLTVPAVTKIIKTRAIIKMNGKKR
jgi:hypothetical protein